MFHIQTNKDNGNINDLIIEHFSLSSREITFV